MLKTIYEFMASARLALALLLVIFVSCILGVTVWRGAEAGRLIFAALWFNGLLVFLVVNIAFCFFGRIWGRRVTVVSFGMILFHVSFIVVLLAIAFNSLFYFRGIIRLTEGETLASSDRQSYDAVDEGRFFRYGRLRGETSLIKMHRDYNVGGEDKRAAYEIAVGEKEDQTKGIIYVTQSMSHRGVEYYNEKEGYSLLLMLSDKQGEDVYGLHVPLQSLVLDKDSYRYFTGYRNEGGVNKGVIPYPAPPDDPYFALEVEYFPAKLAERAGEVEFTVYPLDSEGMPNFHETLAAGKTEIGTPFDAGEYFLTAKEVRYWVGMQVKYEPGKPIVLASLWVSLGGMVVTYFGRIFRKKKAI